MHTEKINAPTLRRMAGLLTQTEAAATLNVDLWTFFGWTKAGTVPRPRTTIGNGKRRYYNQDQVEELRRIVDGGRA